jgi:hypothetical protein
MSHLQRKFIDTYARTGDVALSDPEASAARARLILVKQEQVQ